MWLIFVVWVVLLLVVVCYFRVFCLGYCILWFCFLEYGFLVWLFGYLLRCVFWLVWCVVGECFVVFVVVWFLWLVIVICAFVAAFDACVSSVDTASVVLLNYSWCCDASSFVLPLWVTCFWLLV